MDCIVTEPHSHEKVPRSPSVSQWHPVQRKHDILWCAIEYLKQYPQKGALHRGVAVPQGILGQRGLRGTLFRRPSHVLHPIPLGFVSVIDVDEVGCTLL